MDSSNPPPSPRVFRGSNGPGSDVTASTTITPDELARLFREHGEGLAGAVRGVLGAQADVQEILQEAFLKTHRACGNGTTPANPVAWIFVVTLNLSKDLRRKQTRRGSSLPLEETDQMNRMATGAAPSARLENEEAVEAARAAIARLRDAEKEVFLLRVSAGLTFEAIAAALGIPVGTAKTRMRTALDRLRARLAAFAPACEQRRETS